MKLFAKSDALFYDKTVFNYEKLVTPDWLQPRDVGQVEYC